MKKILISLAAILVGISAAATSVIRINQIGYLPESTKVAVMMTTSQNAVKSFLISDIYTGKTVFEGEAVAAGPLGRMKETYRLDFSSFQKEGAYKITVRTADGEVCSPIFPIGTGVYDGTADFVLNYMRQQRCGYNPFLRESCHTKDGYIVWHTDPQKDSTWIDVTGGWHDASDCLQYTTTSANAIYQMAFAYEEYPEVFKDSHKTDGTPGSNGVPDIVDEIRWGLDWLSRMNPEPGEFYNQIADDRDHVGMRKPHEDIADYGWGQNNGRPVYFCSGLPQERGRKFGLMNATTGVASTTGKYCSSFTAGARVIAPFYPDLAATIEGKALDAYRLGLEKPGVCQTASVKSRYIYEEDNWVDDMELAAVELYKKTGDRKYLTAAIEYGRREPVTPWMGADSAKHYQWYPFMNMGHYRLASEGKEEFIRNLRSGIARVYEKAQGTPFLYGIPSIWCSNNLTTAMLTQCILYRRLTGDRTYEKMEGALRDWLLGCNPWGVSMIVELPLGGEYPREPHSFLAYQKIGNTTGGLVDGPVYSTIFNSLAGVYLDGGNAYEEFQPGIMVYHDCMHDYSTNEPTMDGTASLTFPLAFYESEGRKSAAGNADKNVYYNGGIYRADPSKKRISLVFTAADKADGADPIIRTLKKKGVKGAFFFTGEFFDLYPDVVKRLLEEGHYVGSHSYGHLLYSSWENRDSMLVSKEEFTEDMLKSYRKMAEFGISRDSAPYFIPPYEHYNSLVSSWAREMGLQVVNYTPGTLTNGDYTTPSMARYFSSKDILKKIREVEKKETLNGHIMLIHFGTAPERTDKFYLKLGSLIDELRRKGYEFVPLEEALES